MDDSKIEGVEDIKIERISIEHSETIQSEMSMVNLWKIILDSKLNQSLKSINTWGTKINNDKLSKIINDNNMEVTTWFNSPMEFINSFE